MKGQAFIISETMIDLLKNILTIAVFLGLFLLFTTYNIKIKDTSDNRIIFDGINVIIGNKCLVYEDESGNLYRNIFDERKLNRGDVCIDQNLFEVEITDFEKIWRFGSSKQKVSIVLPTTVYSDGKIKFGKMVIKY
ncbi:MAG: hypothetical protein QXS37_03035 [Candidatus Aenigmatarchaeota archaeon]